MNISLYDALQNISYLREAFDTVQDHFVENPSGWDVFSKKVDHMVMHAERNALTQAMSTNPLLPAPLYAGNNFSLEEQIGASEYHDDWLHESRKEISNLIGPYQIRNNTLSESAKKRTEYISERIKHHFN
jgi:hypothetical protein